MNWLAWQQHKKQFLMMGVLFAGIAAVIIPSGMHFWHVYQQALSNCGTTHSCNQLTGTLFKQGFDKSLLSYMQMAPLAIPVILALFWGAPLITREYTEKTNLFVWTRSVSRKRWLTVKLTWVLTASALFSGAFAALTTWWWRTGNALYLTKFHALDFSVQGFSIVAFTVLAVALGIAFGALLKRTLAALACTLGVLIALLVLVPNFVRPHYATPVIYKAPIAITDSIQDPSQVPRPPKSGAIWVTNSALTSPQGVAFNWSNPQTCAYTPQEVSAKTSGRSGGDNGKDVADSFVSRGDGNKVVSMRCLSSAGYTWYVHYQPANRYWTFQGIETGLYLVLAVIPLTFTYWLVLRRDA